MYIDMNTARQCLYKNVTIKEYSKTTKISIIKNDNREKGFPFGSKSCYRATLYMFFFKHTLINWLIDYFVQSKMFRAFHDDQIFGKIEPGPALHLYDKLSQIFTVLHV